MDREELLAAIERAEKECWTRIGLWGQKIEELPESIGRLINLKSLNFWDNRLMVLPESIGQLTNLRSLDFGHNNLTVLPESIDQLTKLVIAQLGVDKMGEIARVE
jgi:internalin A